MDTSTEVKIKGRPSKAALYPEERSKILSKIYNILELDEDKTFYLYDIDNNSDKKQQIMDLSEEIKLYFNSGGWGVFSKENISRPYLSLVRCLLRDMRIRYAIVSKSLERDGKYVSSSGLMILE